MNVCFGPIDPELYVLGVEDAEDKIIGSILNFGCRPIYIYPCLPPTITTDYPGDIPCLAEQIEGGIRLFTLRQEICILAFFLWEPQV